MVPAAAEAATQKQKTQENSLPSETAVGKKHEFLKENAALSHFQTALWNKARQN